jgi:hypothetical protein
MGKIIGGTKEFKDDPRADKYDSEGKYITKYGNARHVAIGKNLTLEEAKELHRRDVNMHNMYTYRISK